MNARRHQQSNLEDHSEGAWAVSYADLLMVLMSFFIIFFNIDDTSKADIFIQKMKADFSEMAQEMNMREPASLGEGKGLSDQEGGLGPGPGAKGEGTKNLPGFKDGVIKVSEFQGRLPSKWNTIMKGKGKRKGILIEFPPNIYSSGQFELDRDIKKMLDKVAEKVAPYQKEVQVVIVGHADSTPIKNTKKLIGTNFMLSSVRAAKAVEYLIDKGMDPLSVNSSGVSVFARNSRSLSVRIERRYDD